MALTVPNSQTTRRCGIGPPLTLLSSALLLEDRIHIRIIFFYCTVSSAGLCIEPASINFCPNDFIRIKTGRKMDFPRDPAVGLGDCVKRHLHLKWNKTSITRTKHSNYEKGTDQFGRNYWKVSLNNDLDLRCLAEHRVWSLNKMNVVFSEWPVILGRKEGQVLVQQASHGSRTDH